MLKKSLLLLVVTLTLIVGMAQASLADSLDVIPDRGRPEPQPVPIVVAGEVKELLEDGFMLAAGAREIQIRVGEETEYRIPDVETPGLESIVEGDQAAVTGVFEPTATPGTTPGVILAKLVVIRRPEPQPIRVAGVVANKGNAGFDLQAESGRIYPVIVNDRTRYQIPGMQNPTYADVQDGDQAIVSGIWQADPAAATANQLLAQLVVIRRPLPPRIAGKVTEIADDLGSFKLADANSSIWDIQVTEQTQFQIPGVPDPGLDDVRIGDEAVVTVAPSTAESTSVVALLVAIRRPAMRLEGRVSGWLSDVRGFELTTADGAVWQVRVDADTEFEIPGVPGGNLVDVKLGDQAIVIGQVPVVSSAAALIIEADRVIIRRPVIQLAGIVIEVSPPTSNRQYFRLRTAQQQEWTINVDRETEYRIPGDPDPQFSDIEVDDYALVSAPPSTSNVPEVTADLVVLRKAVFRLAGRVTAKFGEDDTTARRGFTLLVPNTLTDDQGSEWTVYVNGDTEYRIPGVESPSFDNIQVGDKAQVTSEPPEEGSQTVLAETVTICCRVFEVAGKVTEIEMNSTGGGWFLLLPKNADAAWRIEVDGDTQFRIPGDETPEFADLRVGDRAVAITNEPPVTTALAFTADLVIVHHPQPVRMDGVVTAVNLEDDSFDLQARNDASADSIKTILTDENTNWVITGVRDPSLEDLEVGAKAMVWAWEDEETSELLASRVIAHNPRPKPVNLLGEITAIDDAALTFELTLRSGEVKVIETNNETRYHIPGMPGATFESLEEGAMALVNAMESPDGTLTALNVVVQRPRPRLGRVAGQIRSIAEETNDDGTRDILVQMGDRLVTVRVNDDTVYRIPGDEDPGLEDLQVGDYVVANGEWIEENVLLAKAIGLVPVRLSAEDGL